MEEVSDQKNSPEQGQLSTAEDTSCSEVRTEPHGTRLCGSSPNFDGTNSISFGEGSSSTTTPQRRFANTSVPVDLIRPQFVFGQNQTRDTESSSQNDFGMDLQGAVFGSTWGFRKLHNRARELTDYVPLEIHKLLGAFVDRMEDTSKEINELFADLRGELPIQDLRQLKEAVTEAVQQNTKKIKEQLEEFQEVLPKLIREEIKILVADEIQQALNQLESPLVREIREVGSAVMGVQQAVKATHKEVCLANLMARMTLEQFRTELDSHLTLNDRDGQEALTLADDFVRDEPIFVLDRHYSHRIRVGLAHKHQSNAKNFRIKYISVKPADGIELGLKLTETLHPSEGSEVVALFPWDSMESVGLLTSCSQLGMVGDKYVDVAIVIGVEVTMDKTSSKEKHLIEMKGRILCLPVSGSGHMTFRKFLRSASKKWKQAPQWMKKQLVVP